MMATQQERIMAVDLNTIKALTFDVGGTIFDWHHTIRDEVERLAQARGVTIDGAAFTNDWRRDQHLSDWFRSRIRIHNPKR